MTFEERVEKAAMAIQLRGSTCYQDMAMARNAVALAFEAGFPDLYGEKPTAWIAPWEATKPMLKAFWRTKGHFWPRMRDAHLKHEAGK